MLCVGRVITGQIVIDGYEPGALYDETERRPGLADLGPEPDFTPEELDELSDRDPNLQRSIDNGQYVMFQEVKPGWAQSAEMREEHIGT